MYICFQKEWDGSSGVTIYPELPKAKKDPYVLNLVTLPTDSCKHPPSVLIQACFYHLSQFKCLPLLQGSSVQGCICPFLCVYSYGLFWPLTYYINAHLLTGNLPDLS